MTITTATTDGVTATTYRVGNHVLEVHSTEGRTTGWIVTTLWSEGQVVRLNADKYLPEITTTVQSGAKVTTDSLLRDVLEAKSAETLFTAVIETL